MSKENDLFTKDAIDRFVEEAVINVTERKVIVYDYKLQFNGKSYDAADLYHTMMQIVDGEHIALNDRDQIELLKSIGAIRSEGSFRSCIPASTGPNFLVFINFLENHFKAQDTRAVNDVN